MRYDEAKIDEAVLAVLYLTAWEEHGMTRAWKGIDWGATNRLHERGLIDDPKNKNKSVIFTEKGLALARAAAERLFSSEPHKWCVTNAERSPQNCVEDGGRSPGVGLQGQTPNHRVLLRSKDVVVSDAGKVVR